MKILKKLNVSKMWIAVIGAVCLAAALMIPMMSFANTATEDAVGNDIPTADNPINTKDISVKIIFHNKLSEYTYEEKEAAKGQGTVTETSWSYTETFPESDVCMFQVTPSMEGEGAWALSATDERMNGSNPRLDFKSKTGTINKVLVDGEDITVSQYAELKTAGQHTVEVWHDGQTTNYSVSGKLVDTKGNPMANQTAKLYYYPETTPALTTPTDTDGTFAFEGVPEGSTIAVTFNFENGEVKTAYVPNISMDTDLGNLVYRIDCYIDFTIDSAKGKIVGANDKEYPAGTFDTWEGTKVTLTDTGADFVFPAEYGEEMSVKAVANEGYTFAGFTVTDAETGDELSSPFEINSDIKAVANFKEVATTATGSSSTGDATPFVIIAVIAVVAGASAFAARKFNNR